MSSQITFTQPIRHPPTAVCTESVEIIISWSLKLGDCEHTQVRPHTTKHFKLTANFLPLLLCHF